MLKNRLDIRLLLSAFGIFIFTIPVSVMRPLGGDESIFLYAGQTLRHGDSLYSTFYDHKGPILYLLNSFTLIFDSNHFIVLPFIQTLLIAISVYYLNLTLKSYGTANRIIFVINLLFFSSLILILDSFGSTELWSLPLQLFTYCALFRLMMEKSRSFADKKLAHIISGILVGLSFAVVTLLRPNNAVGMFFASIFVFTVSSKLVKIRFFLTAFIAALSVYLLIAIYVIESGSSSEFIKQFIFYNLDYASGYGYSEKIMGFALLAFKAIAIPLILGICTCSILLYRRFTMVQVFLFAIVITDFLSQSISGHGARAYLVAILAGTVICLGSLFVNENCEITSTVIKTLSLLLLFSFVTQFSIDTFAANWHLGHREQKAAAVYLGENSNSDTSIYFYGGQVAPMVIAHRRSISRFIFLAPVLSKFSRNQQAMASELTTTVENGKPQIIVRDPSSCPFDSQICYDGDSRYFSENVALNSLRKWIFENYTLKDTVAGVEFWYPTKV